jgi:hypothetical protein
MKNWGHMRLIFMVLARWESEVMMDYLRSRKLVPITTWAP